MPALPDTLIPEARARQTSIWRIPDWALALGWYCKLCGGTTLHWSDCPEFLLIQRTKRPASLRPLLTWALVVFLAGAFAGSAATFLVQRSALSSVGSTVSPLTSAVEPAEVRAAHGSNDRETADEARANIPEPARAVSSTVDVLPATASEGAPIPSLLTRSADGSRDDPSPAASTTRTQPTSRSFARANEQVIRAAAAEFGVDPDALLALAMCESSLNVLAVGKAGEVSTFQFKPATFAWFARDSALGYDLRDIGDLRAQARVTAWAIAEGRGSHWSCWP